MEWVKAVTEITKGQVVAIDGKSIRHSHDSFIGESAIHKVSGGASANGLVMGQIKVD